MNENSMQHGLDWSGENIDGWIATEKFNGCRAYWDGENLWSRGGIKISIPETWREVLPANVHLDGEIYDGIDGVYRCGSAIRYGRFTSTMRFVVFDCSSTEGNYLARLAHARKYQKGPVKVAAALVVHDLLIAKQLLCTVHSRGGEGLMLRHPEIQYYPGRTNKLLKLKSVPQ